MNVRIRLTQKRELVMVVAAALLFVLPVLYSARTLMLRLDSDYDSTLPAFSYAVHSIRTTSTLPTRNPYVSLGIPVIADPLTPVLNPFFMAPLIVFGADFGMRIAFLLIVIASGLSMWVLLTRLGVTGAIRTWGAIHYQIAGTLVSQFASGHLTMLAYPVIPLFLFFALTSSPRPWEKVGIAMTMAYMIFSGDFYMAFFLALMLVVIRGYYAFVFRHKAIGWHLSQLVVPLFLFLLFSSVKLVPFLRDVYPSSERYFPIDPFAGSVHALLFPLPFVMPFAVSFYDRPFFQRLLGFHYNWYEYYSFISPLPFVFLVKLPKILKKHIAKLTLVLLFVGACYISLKYPYSPFYWLFQNFPPVQAFRVPQRILVPMTAVVIALLTLCGHWWTRHVKKPRERLAIAGVMIGSILWTFLTTQQLFYKSFEPARTREASVVAALRRADQTDFYVATFACCLQTFLVGERIPIINYYYGWRTKDSPNFVREDTSGYNYHMLTLVRPTYVITPSSVDVSIYEYQPFIEEGGLVVWRTETPNIFPQHL